MFAENRNYLNNYTIVCSKKKFAAEGPNQIHHAAKL